ncbi:hypothetical protein [Catalinimonas niigatensis]|uniref:hypothetical protein n=1 Tax=Catalinimonas niigatensis TaxID=1397264 RepID=UPI002664F069|nr:hypothetical protein [Catalinimonas niigatensis]WPP51461.1 hypothetical protein PZB72_03545 [Catalinimonas niigatensis]
MLKHIKFNKRSLIRWKVYIDRARMYIGYLQFFMIGFVFFESFREESIGELIFNHLYLSIPILFLAFIFLSLIIGYIDSKMGFREEELRNSSYSNPMFREIYENLQEVKMELQQLKEKEQFRKPH